MEEEGLNHYLVHEELNKLVANRFVHQKRAQIRLH